MGLWLDVPMTEPPVSIELRTSAAGFAESALRAYLAEDHAVFLLHAATALEQLSKAFLASIHGSLIAAANDFDSLLHLCGHAARTRSPRARMRTITAQDALKRVGQLIPPIDNLSGSLQLLILVRNGVVHAGQVEASTDVLVPFLRACEHMLAEIPNADREAFWADSLELVDARLSESTDAAKVAAADAIAGARRRYADRYHEIAPALRSAMIATVEDTYAPEKYEQTLWTCPACEHQALVHGSYDVDWEPDWDYSDGEAWVAGVTRSCTSRQEHSNAVSVGWSSMAKPNCRRQECRPHGILTPPRSTPRISTSENTTEAQLRAVGTCGRSSQRARQQARGADVPGCDLAHQCGFVAGCADAHSSWTLLHVPHLASHRLVGRLGTSLHREQRQSDHRYAARRRPKGPPLECGDAGLATPRDGPVPIDSLVARLPP